MNKVTFDVFSNMLSMAVELMTDDERNEFYIDLLESGSSCYSPSEENELCFSIANGLLEFEARGYKHLEPGFDDDAKLSNEAIKEIDDIVNSDVDDDPIDLAVLQKEADELIDEGRELTEQEIMEIGYNPWTNEKVNLNSLLETCDRYLVVIKEMLEQYSKKEGFEYMVQIQREKLVEFNLMKTIIKFYQDKVKLQASDGEI